MYFSLILSVSQMWIHTPLTFFLFATLFCSCTNLLLLKSWAYWDPSFGHAVLMRKYFAIPEGKEWYSMWMSVHPHWEHRSFRAAGMGWGWAQWLSDDSAWNPTHLLMAFGPCRCHELWSGLQCQCLGQESNAKPAGSIQPLSAPA